MHNVVPLKKKRRHGMIVTGQKAQCCASYDKKHNALFIYDIELMWFGGQNTLNLFVLFHCFL